MGLLLLQLDVAVIVVAGGALDVTVVTIVVIDTVVVQVIVQDTELVVNRRIVTICIVINVTSSE